MYSASLFPMLRQASKRLRTIGVPDITRSRKDPSVGRVLFRCLQPQCFYRTSSLYRILVGFTSSPLSISPHLFAQGRAIFTKDCSMLNSTAYFLS